MSDGVRPRTGQASERFLRGGMLVLFIQHLCIMPNGSFALLCFVFLSLLVLVLVFSLVALLSLMELRRFSGVFNFATKCHL